MLAILDIFYVKITFLIRTTLVCRNFKCVDVVVTPLLEDLTSQQFFCECTASGVLHMVTAPTS